MEPVYIRRMAIVHFLKYKVELFERVAHEIRGQYGLEEDRQAGKAPYTMKSYFLEMVKDKVWCDSVMLLLLASMWSAKITLLRSDSCKEIRLRHEKELQDADFVVVFNCSETMGHYSSVFRDHIDVLEIGQLSYSSNWDEEVDETERERYNINPPVQGGADEYLMVRKERVIELTQKEKRLAQITKICSGSGDLHHSPSKRRKELEENLQPPEPGDTFCKKCEKNFDRPGALYKHYNTFHLNEFPFVCTKCNKGFTTKQGLTTHTAGHEEETKEEHTCPECFTKVASKKALKRHMDDQHGEPHPRVKCRFQDKGCTSDFKDKWGERQHMQLCKLNPNPPEYFCPVCKDGPWHLEKKLKEHMRLIHGHQ